MTDAPLFYRFDDRQFDRWLILDRDGTLNRDAGYTHEPADLEILPGVVDALSRLSDDGWGMAIATNQSGIACGTFGVDSMVAFNNALVRELADTGVVISAIAACPHSPTTVPSCTCRKPQPGLIALLSDACHMESDLTVFVGNSAVDFEAASRAGVRFLWGRDESDWTTVAAELMGAS